MFDPIVASENIRDSYIDYITTTFKFADDTYAEEFRRELNKEGEIAKGPYLDFGGSYETGKSMRELVEECSVSSLFPNLEQADESEKELKMDRPLYVHQEEAIAKAAQDKNLIVTTGTGSGKTECFLLPILNHLLGNIEQGTLSDSVYAIVIYPMNALANDQLKRMRKLLKDFPQIRFGLYNGNTETTQKDALKQYLQLHDGSKPLENEVISREMMHEKPPHILITNYSMMEYMLLRPNDGRVFTDAHLKFIILDEAHIYRGATGIETSILLRRMRARIGHSDKLQYILTSATLGGPDENDRILEFGKRLCGADFDRDSVIRSKEKKNTCDYIVDVPMHVFIELEQNPGNTDTILDNNGIPANGKEGEERVAELCSHNKAYAAIKQYVSAPVTIVQLYEIVNREIPVTLEELRALISVCGRVNCLKIRYHYFIRALEGAYITLNEPKRLWLSRKNNDITNNIARIVFETAVCTDCGRIAVTGRRDEKGCLIQQATINGIDENEYYVIKDPADHSWFNDDENDDTNETDYLLCSVCGTLKNDNGKSICSHDKSQYIKLRKVKKSESGRCTCPACGTGTLRRVYLGNEAATEVIGTELYEQLPDSVIKLQAKPVESSMGGLFKRKSQPVTECEKEKQYLCFSDSRSEAAYFASDMERYYREFLRRRGVWHIAKRLREKGRTQVPMGEFVNELTNYFENNKSFVEWDEQDKSAYQSSVSNAWVAMLNELFNFRRSTSLMSMGVLSFGYHPNLDFIKSIAEEFGIDENEAAALLDLLILDGVTTGALDAGKKVNISEADREYIFYTSTPHKLIKVKGPGEKNSESGWCARKRSNGSYYPNVKLSRLCRDLGISQDKANEILDMYWSAITDGKEKYAFDANDFDVILSSYDNTPFFRCEKCSRVTPYNVGGRCINVNCPGRLQPFDAYTAYRDSHYTKLYRSEKMKPLFIKEHTAQLSKKSQSVYQDAFVRKKINVLSCSTTFEMGVDVGSLETVYMRNVPPSPSNYVQRAGRAGRSRDAAAFVLTYAKLSSHDFTYFKQPEAMITGSINAPVFSLDNEKVVRRHIFAIALSYFFHQDPEAFDNDNRSAFLNDGGYLRLKEMLTDIPEELTKLLRQSIPDDNNLHERMGINNGDWVKLLIGDDDGTGEMGTLEEAYRCYRDEIEKLENASKYYHRINDPVMQAAADRQLQYMRASKEDNVGKRRLIDFLVRNNILPKYGFPVDTVELETPDRKGDNEDQRLQLQRDLQLAIAEYAPGSEVIADGKMYISRFIRKGFGKNKGATWEEGRWAKCAMCEQVNFIKGPNEHGETPECVSCHHKIPAKLWHSAIEPRRGFQTESGDGRPVPMHRPEKGYKTDDYYIGDTQKKLIRSSIFMCGEKQVKLESTSNDSLVIISTDPYIVCPTCGYAVSDEGTFPDKHKNSRGFDCTGEAKKAKHYYLSHDFKTDVVKITFQHELACELNRMLSVMYALLEGLSREMGIERNDIKGCLYREQSMDGGMQYSIILYDAVAGGAGNVRRMVSDTGEEFTSVVKAAIKLLEGCNCDTSCYGCLRNYYNQKIHDKLDRHKALDFLNCWSGRLTPVSEEPDANDEVTVEADNDLLKDYSGWREAADTFGLGDSVAAWENKGIAYSGCLLAVLHSGNEKLETIVVWPDKKLAVCGTVGSETDTFVKMGWTVLTPDDDIEKFM